MTANTVEDSRSTNGVKLQMKRERASTTFKSYSSSSSSSSSSVCSTPPTTTLVSTPSFTIRLSGGYGGDHTITDQQHATAMGYEGGGVMLSAASRTYADRPPPPSKTAFGDDRPTHTLATEGCIKCRRRYRMRGESIKTNELKRLIHYSLTVCRFCEPLRCKKCPYFSNNWSNMCKHAMIHTDIRPYKCSKCTRTFVEKANMDRHLRTHTRESRFECSICRRRFIQKHVMVRHMKLHQNIRPHKCTLCNKTFITSTSLMYHTNTHTRATLFECNVCARKFSLKFSRDRHMGVHRGIRNFKCPICLKLVREKYDFWVHLRRHKDIFHCMNCGENFTSSLQFSHHLNQSQKGCTEADKKSFADYVISPMFRRPSPPSINQSNTDKGSSYSQTYRRGRE